MYNYALLDPRQTPEARTHNDQVLGDGSTVLGIEVTVPELAARCGLGNLDPQHLGGDAQVAAIEAAWTHSLPPDGSALVTVRADADAVGAMAVLSYRWRCGGITWNDEYDWWERAGRIATADNERTGEWPGPLSISDAADLVTEVSGISAVVMDHSLPFAKRVEIMGGWLATGGLIGIEGGTSAIRGRLLADARAAIAALDVRVTCYPEPPVAVVTGSHRLATAIGYRCAPLVVATNPEFCFNGGQPHRKHTVARWNSQFEMDWEGLQTALQNAEPGWGGSASVLGSPQGVSSTLTTEDVLDLVIRHVPADQDDR